MLGTLLEWQRASLQPLVSLGRQAIAPFDQIGLATAWADLTLANLRAGEARDHDLVAAVERDANGPIEHRMIGRQPFWRLHAFRPAGGRHRHRILVASPYSGYATTLMSGLIAGLVDDAEVLVTDWPDARLVPEALGVFDHDDQIETFAQLMRQFAGNLHVVAISQSAIPALAAVALLAEDEPAAAPATLSLLGGPIDPRINATPANHMLRATPPEVIELIWFGRVGAGHPGAGRRVLPSLHQLLIYACAHPEPFIAAQFGTLVESVIGEIFGAARALAELHAVIDVPAELAGQVLRDVFHQPALATHRLVTKERPVRPTAITTTALMTVEAGIDGLVGLGQTHAAHDLVPALPAERRAAQTLWGAAHYALFNGPAATRQLGPDLCRFMAEQSR